MAVLASALWRRIDTPGHEACRLEQNGSGWCLQGTAVFRHEVGPASLAYAVRCDARWETLSGQVRGFLGERPIDYAVSRGGSVWTLNGSAVPGLDHLVDLDLGFTPATNLQQLQRVPIARGEQVELPVAWLDVDAGTLTELPQTYERRGETTFWYTAPSLGYEGLLELAPNGFIRRYPDLWEVEPAP
ncbi:MAG: putative glycolipid-binding domain-containing protein [Candidatus Rokuibacteriota bacterium]